MLMNPTQAVENDSNSRVSTLVTRSWRESYVFSTNVFRYMSLFRIEEETRTFSPSLFRFITIQILKYEPRKKRKKDKKSKSLVLYESAISLIDTFFTSCRTKKKYTKARANDYASPFRIAFSTAASHVSRSYSKLFFVVR